MAISTSYSSLSDPPVHLSSNRKLFPAGRSEYLSFEGSDHRPLITFFDDSKRKKKGLFRFDRRLREKPEIRKLVEESWPLHSPESVLSKICRIRRQIIQWTKEQNSLNVALLKASQAALEAALSSPSPDQTLITSLTSSLVKNYEEEELFWRQRSRIQWLQEGDRNSSFFHASTRGRRARNKFSVIEDDQGQVFFDEVKIARTVASYFRNIFTSTSCNNLDVVNEAISSKVSSEMNMNLIKIPDDLEIKQAVFSISSEKAPGPDGFSAGFYQSFWDVIGDDVARDIRFFFESGSLHQRQNETHVCLIPKIKGPKKVADYRPIALCNTHYKIIAKILTRRLQPLLPQLISKQQSAFVPKRAISDNVLITHEMLHYLRISGATKRCSMAVKTDMSKAYDRIEWGFLQAVLERMGFHDMWITWIMECVSSVSYSFLINGTAYDRVQPSRGLRQGDPLSPYLFILCTEVLSGLCMKAQENGSLPGIKVARGSPAINHLLFADDTMFFCRSDGFSCSTLVSILKRYELASGQCINLAKSAITFSSKTPLEAKERVKRTLHIVNEGGIGKYLGLPEHFGRKKKDIFASIIDRIRQKAHSWSSRFLSSAGKQTLLKAVLSAMPSYTMSCFKIPLSLCKQIQSVLTRFWWDSKPDKKKLCWISWDKLTLPKGEGGLGFREIETFNDALLAKLAWRILKAPDSLLSQTLLGKYCHVSSFMECRSPAVSSHGWRGILAGREVLKHGLGWVIGNGSQIPMWNSNWLSTSQPLAPIGPPTEENQGLMVSDLLLPQSHEWNLTAIRKHLPQYEDNIKKLNPSEFKMGDELSWLPERSGVYSTKTGYNLAKKIAMAAPRSSFNWNQCVWRVKTSPKLKSFLWKLKNKALPVAENLALRGINVENSCKRCGAMENELHILLHCPFASRVWDLIPALYKPVPSVPISLDLLLQSNRLMLNLPPIGISSTPLYPWVYWNLWTSRNQLLFEDKTYSCEQVAQKAVKDAREWHIAQEKSALKKATPPSSRSRHAPPPPYALQMFVDAAWDSGSGSCGMGWVVKDGNEAILLQNSANRRFVGSAFIAEALAVKAALSDAVSSGIRDLTCLSDSKNLISLLTDNGNAVELQGILHDIRVLSSSFDFICFSFVPRLKNMSADSVAKSALLLLNCAHLLDV